MSEKDSYDYISDAVKAYWQNHHPQDVVAFFQQKYSDETDWDYHEEVVFCKSSFNYEDVTFLNDFCEGQTCVKDITIVPLTEVIDHYVSTKDLAPRVMLIKELEDTDEPVFIELRTKEEDEEKLTCFGLLEHWDGLAFHFIIDQWLLDGKPFFRIYGCELKRKEYNIQWRPWNKRPTIEQMKAVKWDE